MAIQTTDLSATLGKIQHLFERECKWDSPDLTDNLACKCDDNTTNALLDDFHYVVAHRGFGIRCQMRPRRGLLGVGHGGGDDSGAGLWGQIGLSYHSTC